MFASYILHRWLDFCMISSSVHQTHNVDLLKNWKRLGTDLASCRNSNYGFSLSGLGKYIHFRRRLQFDYEIVLIRILKQLAAMLCLCMFVFVGNLSTASSRMYVNDVKSGTCDAAAVPKILQESPATAWVDGQNGLGAVIGNFCMDIAIQKAKDIGVGWVCAKGSNHFGIAGMYSLQALKQGLLGLSFTNTSPLMSPTRSKEAALGTNPISLGAPALDGDSFVLDMATTAVAVGKIEMKKRRHEPIPEGWAQDKQGRVTTDAEIAYNAACLMPLGGLEISAGYKGFGLGLLVEIFCGISAGAHFGNNIRKWGQVGRPADLGQCFVAVDPKCFAPGFEGRLSELLDHIRNMEPAEPSKPVMVAGDPERFHMAAVDQAGGVRYVKDQMETCARLASTLNVSPLQPL